MKTKLLPSTQQKVVKTVIFFFSRDHCDVRQTMNGTSHRRTEPGLILILAYHCLVLFGWVVAMMCNICNNCTTTKVCCTRFSGKTHYISMAISNMAMGQNPGTVREHQNSWDLWMWITTQIWHHRFWHTSIDILYLMESL